MNRIARQWAQGLVVASIVLGVHNGDAVARGAEDSQRLQDEASALFTDGHYEEALERYEAAYAVSSFGGLRYAIARCYEELGRLREARETFEAFLGWRDAPEAMRDKARRRIERLDSLLAVGRLVVSTTPVPAELKVDGEPRGRVSGEPRTLELPPGDYELVATAPGFAAARQRVTVVGGEERPLVLELARAREEERASYSPWTWVTLGTGLALVAGGAVAFALGEADHAQVVDAEGYGSGGVVQMYRSKAVALRNSGDDKKLAGYVLWGVGGAALVTSTVLFVLDATRPASTGDSGSLSIGVAPQVGGGLFSLQGRF